MVCLLTVFQNSVFDCSQTLRPCVLRRTFSISLLNTHANTQTHTAPVVKATPAHWNVGHLLVGMATSVPLGRARGHLFSKKRSERERERERGERVALGNGVLNGSWHGHAAPRVEWQRDSLSARLGSCALLLPPLRETHDKVHVHINKPFRSAFLGSMMIAERCAEAFPDR